MFARPALGALHSTFTAKPKDLIQTAIVGALVGPSGAASDTVVFYGFGGGGTREITPHYGVRVAADYARYNFFSNLLNGPRNSVRLSVGLKVGFGKNIVKQ